MAIGAVMNKDGVPATEVLQGDCACGRGSCSRLARGRWPRHLLLLPSLSTLLLRVHRRCWWRRSCHGCICWLPQLALVGCHELARLQGLHLCVRRRQRVGRQTARAPGERAGVCSQTIDNAPAAGRWRGACWVLRGNSWGAAAQTRRLTKLLRARSGLGQLSPQRRDLLLDARALLALLDQLGAVQLDILHGLGPCGVDLA